VKTCPTCGREFPDNVKFCPNDGQTLRAKSPTADLVGQVVADRYHILKKLGEGGMGAVYLGEHVKMGRKSAIKVMAAAMSQDPDAVSRFNREAANASRISHPNVCQVYDFGETPEGLIYLAMEFIEGHSLKDLVEREGALPAARACSIIRQAADALQAAHDLGIVHRDIKPDNIMVVQARDGSDVVKVVDFGIARAVGGDEPGQKVTKTGLVVGTPEYMSPEQLSGDKLDGRTDIYSLALVLYRLLTGTLPFEADSAQEVMIKRLTDEPLPLEQARPDVEFPAKLQLVLNSALARMPEERYQSAADFGRDALDAVAGMPLPQTRVGAAPAQAATELLDSGTVAELTVKQRQAAKRKPAAAAPAEPAAAPRKGSVLPYVFGAVGVVGVGAAVAVVMMMNSGTPPPRGADTTATAQQAATEQTGPTGTQLARNPPLRSSKRPDGQPVQQQSTEPQPQSTPSTATLPAVASWSDTLARANEFFDNDELGTARGLAQRVYAAPGITGQMRASAAILVATTYAGSNQDRMAEWYRNAYRIGTAEQKRQAAGALAQVGQEP
jgi:serine/threonine-protein kinase